MQCLHLLFFLVQLVLNMAASFVSHKHEEGNNDINDEYDEEDANYDHWTSNSSNINRWYKSDC